MNKVLFTILSAVMLLAPISSAYAASIGAYKRPVTFPVNFNIEHTYTCLDQSSCYGYNYDSRIYTSGSVVQGGSLFFGLSISTPSSCVRNLLTLNMGSYWTDGVCHQHTNRGLYYTGYQLSSGVVGYSISKALYGVYGKTWPFYYSTPACIASFATVSASQANPVDATKLKGRINDDNELERNRYYAHERAEAHKKAFQAGAQGDDASRISREFSYTIYEILGSDYSGSKVEKIRKTHEAMLRKDTIYGEELKKNEILEDVFHQKRNKNFAAWLHQVHSILGTDDFEAVFSVRANDIDTTWNDFVKGLQ